MREVGIEEVKLDPKWFEYITRQQFCCFLTGDHKVFMIHWWFPCSSTSCFTSKFVESISTGLHRSPRIDKKHISSLFSGIFFSPCPSLARNSRSVFLFYFIILNPLEIGYLSFIQKMNPAWIVFQLWYLESISQVSEQSQGDTRLIAIPSNRSKHYNFVFSNLAVSLFETISQITM